MSAHRDAVQTTVTLRVACVAIKSGTFLFLHEDLVACVLRVTTRLHWYGPLMGF